VPYTATARTKNSSERYGEKMHLEVPTVFDTATLDDKAFQTGRAATEKAR